MEQKNDTEDVNGPGRGTGLHSGSTFTFQVRTTNTNIFV